MKHENVHISLKDYRGPLDINRLLSKIKLNHPKPLKMEGIRKRKNRKSNIISQTNNTEGKECKHKYDPKSSKNPNKKINKKQLEELALETLKRNGVRINSDTKYAVRKLIKASSKLLKMMIRSKTNIEQNLLKDTFMLDKKQIEEKMRILIENNNLNLKISKKSPKGCNKIKMKKKKNSLKNEGLRKVKLPSEKKSYKH